MKKLTLKNRPPRQRTDAAGKALRPSLAEGLDALLAQAEAEAEAEAQDQDSELQPVVRLKSMDPRNNPNGIRIIMIRRTPYALSSEYEEALKRASFAALLQWYHAGVLDQFPTAAREFAELDIVDHIHEQNKLAFSAAHGLRKRYEDLLGVLNDEIVHEHAPGDFQYDRAIWQIKQTELELFDANAPDNYSRYTKYAHALESGLITSPKAEQLVVQAMLLALCDGYPIANVRDLPEGARGVLRRAVTQKSTQLDDPGVIEDLAKLPKGHWITEGTREGIRQCAKKLAELRGG